MNNKIITLSILLGIIFNFNTQAQYQVLEQSLNPMPESVSYQKYKLDNGLVVIISPNLQNKNVDIDFSYRIGSSGAYSNQTPVPYFIGRTLLKGISNDNGFDLATFTKMNGGQYLQLTTKDQIKQNISLPANLGKEVLWYISENIANYPAYLNESVFESEVAAIHSDCKTYPNNQNLLKNRLGYTSIHPYSWPAQGDLDQLQYLTNNDVLNFYNDWYGINNGVLTISGNVDTSMINVIVDYFGRLPHGKFEYGNYEQSIRGMASDPNFESNNTLQLSYKDYGLNEIQIFYKTSEAYSINESAIKFLTGFLNKQDVSNPFYIRLISQRLATSYRFSYDPLRYSGELVLNIYFDSVSKANTIMNESISTLQEMFSSKGAINYPDLTMQLQQSLFNFILEESNKNQKAIGSNFYRSLHLAKGEIFKEHPDQFIKQNRDLQTLNYGQVLNVASTLNFGHPAYRLLSIVQNDLPQPQLSKATIEALPKMNEHATAPEVVEITSVKEPGFDWLKADKIEFEASKLENGLNIIKISKGLSSAKLVLETNINQYKTDIENELMATVLAELYNSSIKGLIKSNSPFSEILRNSKLHIEAQNNKLVVAVDIDNNLMDPGMLNEILNGFFYHPQPQFIMPDQFLDQLYKKNLAEELSSKLLFSMLSYDLSKFEIFRDNPMFASTEDNVTATQTFQFAMEIALRYLPDLITPKNTTMYFMGTMDENMQSNFSQFASNWFIQSNPDAPQNVSTPVLNKKPKSKGTYLATGNGPLRAQFGFRNFNTNNDRERLYADFVAYYLQVSQNKMLSGSSCRHNFEQMSLESAFINRTNTTYYSIYPGSDLASALKTFEDQLEYVRKNKQSKKEFNKLKSYFANYMMSAYTRGENLTGLTDVPELQKALKSLKYKKIKKFALKKLKKDHVFILIKGNEKMINSLLKDTKYLDSLRIDNLGREL